MTLSLAIKVTLKWLSSLPILMQESFSTNFSPISKKTASANPFQSAYRAGHSTETVLLRIVNDILSALDNDNIYVLLLLDLSAAFDTTDHQILLSRLNSVLGIQSTALQWFRSYISQTDISPLQSITRLRQHHSSCTVCLRVQYWGPFSSSCTPHLSPIS